MSYLLEIMTLMGIFMILAMSLNVICGLTGVLQLGHAGFYALGAYSAAIYAVYCYNPNLDFIGIPAPFWNFAFGACFAMIVPALFSLLIGIPCLRLSGDYLAIATLGFGEIIRMSLNTISFPAPADMEQFRADAAVVPMRQMMTLDYSDRFGEATGINMPFDSVFVQWWFVLILVAVVWILLVNLKRSAIGRALLAIREDEIAARAMGVNLPAYKLSSFVICAVFAGLAGALYAHSKDNISPNDFDLMITIHVLLIVVLGGLGSFSGSLVASVILIGIPGIIRIVPTVLNRMGYQGNLDIARYQQLIFALLLIVLIRLAPNGIFGMNEFRDLFRRRRKPEAPSDD